MAKTLTIDIVNSCNLGCLSCPRGNGEKQAIHFMSPTLLDQILFKAKSECEISDVRLHDWGEPLLHPQLSEIIKVVNSHNLFCHISTNFSFKYIEAKIKEIISLNLGKLSISVSGFNQSIYIRNHRYGDIVFVKNNIAILHKLSKEPTYNIKKVTINYHLYKDNIKEAMLFKRYIEPFGFEIVCMPAFLLPIEQAMKEYKTKDVAKEYQDIYKYMIKCPSELKIFLNENKMSQCPYLYNRISIDSKGKYKLCCATFDDIYTFTSFLDTKYDSIQKKRIENPFCKECHRLGLSAYYLLNDKWGVSI